MPRPTVPCQTSPHLLLPNRRQVAGRGSRCTHILVQQRRCTLRSSASKTASWQAICAPSSQMLDMLSTRTIPRLQQLFPAVKALNSDVSSLRGIESAGKSGRGHQYALKTCNSFGLEHAQLKQHHLQGTFHQLLPSAQQKND